MSELPGNFALEDWMTLDAEQGSSTEDQTFFSPPSNMPDDDFNGMDLDFDVPTIDCPTGDTNISMRYFVNPLALDITASSEPLDFNTDTGSYNNSEPSFNSFASQDMDPFGAMPMPPLPLFAPQHPYPSPYSYQPPPGFMLVPIPQFYAQQPIMSMPMLDPTLVSPEAVNEFPTAKQRVARPKQPKQPPPKLAGPISVLTSDFSAPVKDMMSHASRSTATRHAEAKKVGKVLRPHNRFMMYRAAYADRTKQFASSGSHRDVSRILGVSWKLESQDIIEHFNECSILDSENHQKAFPGYKYAPSNTGSAGRTRVSKKTRVARTPQPDSDGEMTTPKRNTKKKPVTPKVTMRDEDILFESDDETDDLSAETRQATHEVTHTTPSKYNLRRR
ncbi:hypothetical protein E4T43_04709 [Aureobasidium subglaciale]|nr:hypothetical protein E4T43_04709 [Aureobasidium subglaciale]